MTTLFTATRAALLAALLLPMTVFGAEGDAKEAPVAQTDQNEDLSAIREQSKAFVTAFNAGDAAAVAAMWTEHGQYVDDSGRSYIGRKAIEAAYADHFKQHPGMKIDLKIDSLHLLSDEAALEEGRTLVTPVSDGDPGFNAYSAIHVKIDGKWQMASVRDRWVAMPSAHRNIADLEWLIGKWSAEEFGVQIDSECRWIANKSFVERSYTTTSPGGAKASGVQLIGWNPIQGRIQSWNFSPDGGHAVGLWTPIKNGFVAEMRGVTGGGLPTESVNTLTKLDDNAYVWQSTGRSIGGTPLPDTGEVVIKRQTSQP
ncbi:SgcJ/EcaC family oxidoreductase [Blastopirellula sp. JC732]|uniref:SgcJ/EcaC family oxidoreductase n=1 Tax=Blastopirellula sediminis TaxID=2894196 RepID=A0A9X1MJ47_9BACT|nr:SgcJ/EcaC family oxidoreductase [Blastopirellula sediminis]MCC9607962.1 SgcJ/EcaC family oxidoreductase [Blastopirellula sediminis]MCC9627245.1 SgcJ/EcaC family oxidoreductase [Blastopirellula sediminis]